MERSDVNQLRSETAMGFATLYPVYVPETNMDKIDFKKKLSTLYSAPNGSFATVDVPVMKFVKVDGKGDPNRDPAYKAAVEWLYSLSYAMKFASKTRSERTTSFRRSRAFGGPTIPTILPGAGSICGNGR